MIPEMTDNTVTFRARYLRVPVICALSIGVFLMLFRQDRPVSGRGLGLVWLFVSMIGSSAYHVLRTQEKRLADMEDRLAQLAKRS